MCQGWERSDLPQKAAVATVKKLKTCFNSVRPVLGRAFVALS